MNYLLKILLSFGLLFSVSNNSFAEDKFDTLSNRVSELEKRINLLSYGLSKISKSSVQSTENKIEDSSSFPNTYNDNSFPHEKTDDTLDASFVDDFPEELSENNLEDPSYLSETNGYEDSFDQETGEILDSSFDTQNRSPKGMNARTSNSGVLGTGYVGIGFLHAWNNDYDVTHQEVYIEARNPLLEILDLNGHVGIAVSDNEGGPYQIYSDGLGNSFYLPKHNRWSVGASLGLDLHHEFSVSDGFSIDPFIGVSLPLDYYFTTEYDVISELSYGYSLSLGVEFLLFDSLSIIPRYKNTTSSYLIEDGSSFTADSRSSFALTMNYFFTNSFFSFAYYHELDVKWRGLSFSYNFGY